MRTLILWLAYVGNLKALIAIPYFWPAWYLGLENNQYLADVTFSTRALIGNLLTLAILLIAKRALTGSLAKVKLLYLVGVQMRATGRIARS